VISNNSSGIRPSSSFFCSIDRPSNPNDVNPYAYTPDQKMPSDALPKLGSLGSLAQASRGQQLKSARTTLIAIGALTVIVNLVMMALLPDQVRKALQENGQAPNQEAVNIAMGVAMAMQGSFLVLGIVFIICGILVKRFPVPCTVGALVLYILAALATAALDPSTLARGIIIKIFIVVALFKAVQAAFAYQKEMEASGA
jgi:preprotein translocase subunit SecF